MRVALLQIRLDARSPAGNLQGVLRGVDRAADTTPAPDLLVLPGACDTGGTEPAASYPLAVLESFKEALTYKGREWGVFIAAGLHIRDVGGTLVAASALFDPDGDIVAWSMASACGVEFWPSAVGVLGVFEPTVSHPTDGPLSAPVKNAFIAMPLGRTRDTRQNLDVRAMADAARCNTASCASLYWGVVSPAEPNGGRSTAPGGSTFVLGKDDSLLAHVDTVEETILYAEIPLMPVAAEARQVLFREKDKAD
jgi:predicted amidohydrolase